MSGVIRLAMLVTLVLLVNFVAEEEALTISLKKMLSVKSYTEAERARARELMGQRAIDKIKAHFHQKPVVKSTDSSCDGSDIVACLPVGPSQNFSQDMSPADVRDFCRDALQFAECFADIDFSSCSDSEYFGDYQEIAAIAEAYGVVCKPKNLQVVKDNLDCLEQVFTNNDCEKVFDDKPTDVQGLCNDYEKYLQCYYDDTKNDCSDDDAAAEIVGEVVEIIGDGKLATYGVYCNAEMNFEERHRKVQNFLTGLKKKNSEKRSQLMDLLTKLGAEKKKTWEQ